MQDALNYVNWAVDFFKAGFAQVNLILAIVIALYWSWRNSDWSALLASAVGAVLMHIAAIILAPMVDHNAPLHLPPYQDAGFWRMVAALFLGYTVVIGVLFFLKSMILNRGGDEAEAAGGLLMAGAAAGALGHDHHGGGHDDHGHGGGHDDHGHGGGHDDHGHGGGHDDHGHGGGHDDHGHGGGHGDHGHGGGHGHH